MLELRQAKGITCVLAVVPSRFGYSGTLKHKTLHHVISYDQNERSFYDFTLQTTIHCPNDG